MKIFIGNRVKFINENLEGEVISLISDSKILVKTTDGFDYDVSISDIILLNDDETFSFTPPKQQEMPINEIPKNKSFSSVLSRYTRSTKYQFEKVVEIDLHLEELVEFPNKLEDWQKLHTQLQHVKKCMHAAFDEKIKRLVFIHGKGTGVLRIELRNFLSTFDDVIVKEADYREYGGGATEVIIK